MTKDDPLAALRTAATAGRADTVRVCFADHYGVLRGRRLTVEQYLRDPAAQQGFCDGALVWDIRCEIFEQTDFSNYRTGYPDLYVRPDASSLRPCGWTDGEFVVLGDAFDHHGRPIVVDPRGLLRRLASEAPRQPEAMVARLELRVPDARMVAEAGPGRPGAFVDELLGGLDESGLPVRGLTWSRPERTMTLTLGPAAPVELADLIVLARAAAREVAARHGLRLTAMPRIDSGDRPTTLVIAGHGWTPDAIRVGDLELMLRPLPLAYPAEAAVDRALLTASSDANPYLVLAALLAAGPGTDGESPALGGSYRAAIARFAGADWAAEQLGGLFHHDSLALAEREAALREQTVSSWDHDRYWECG